MKLYELSFKYQQLLSMLEDELLDQEAVNQTLEALEESITDKCENIAKIIRTMEAHTGIIKSEMDRLTKYKSSLETRSKSLKEYLLSQMQYNDIKKMNTSLFTISRHTSPYRVEIWDESLLPDQFKIMEVTERIDRSGIIEALKNKEEINGCHLQQDEHIRIK